MKIGIANFPREMKESVADVVAMVALAEEFGFSDAWIPDSQSIWKDPHVVLTLAAMRTSRILLGIGVTNSVTRHPMVSARAILTLHELAPGRMRIGIGAGDTSLKALKSGPARVAQCADYADAVRAFLDAKEVTYEGTQQRLENVPDLPRMPLYIAANGPQMLRLAGRLADGVIVPVGFTEAFVQYVFRHLGVGLRESGRQLEDVDVCFLAGCSLSADRTEARNHVRSYVAKRALVPVPPEISGISVAERDRFIEAYNIQGHMQVGASHGELVPEDWIDRFALAGTADDVVQKIEQLRSWGGRHVLVMPAMPDTAALIRGFGESVIPRVAEPTTR